MSTTGRKRLLIAALGAFLLVAVAGGILYIRDSSTTEAAGQEGNADASGNPDDVTPASQDDAGDAAAKDGKSGDGKEGKDKEKKDTSIPVNVTEIVYGTVSSYITSTANLVSENEVTILAEAEGRVKELLVEEGDQVRKGQVLAQLVRDDAEIAMRKSQVRELNARLAFERGTKTLDAELLSQEDFDKLKMEHEVALQERAEAEWKLDKTTIRAPYTGRITLRNVQMGQHVRPADHLFTIADFDPLIARIYLPERDIYGLSVGRDVRITMKANTDLSFAGRIRQISPVVDTATGTVKVTIDAVRPPDSVRPGAFVTIDIVRETRHKAVLVPREAVVRELQDAYVFVARDNLAVKRNISLGIEEGEMIEALTGLEPGDQVIVAGQGGLKDGATIKVIPPIEASSMALAKDRQSRS